MPDINARIGNIYGPTEGLGKHQTASANRELINPDMDPNIFRKPEYHVYIYTVSDRELTVRRPPIASRLIIPARGSEPYRFVTSLPHPLQTIDHDNNGNMITRFIDGRRAAQDIINPDNTGIDQDATIDPREKRGIGNNLNERGVFWSLNNPPTEEEVEKANRRKEAYYKRILENARVMELSDPKGLQDLISRDYHAAAEYFGVEASWHKKFAAKATCPNCGETIKSATVAFHKSEEGFLCVLDWKRAVDAGVKRKNEVPAGKEYWDTSIK